MTFGVLTVRRWIRIGLQPRSVQSFRWGEVIPHDSRHFASGYDRLSLQGQNRLAVDAWPDLSANLACSTAINSPNCRSQHGKN